MCDKSTESVLSEIRATNFETDDDLTITHQRTKRTKGGGVIVSPAHVSALKSLVRFRNNPSVLCDLRDEAEETGDDLNKTREQARSVAKARINLTGTMTERTRPKRYALRRHPVLFLARCPLTMQHALVSIKYTGATPCSTTRSLSLQQAPFKHWRYDNGQPAKLQLLWPRPEYVFRTDD